MLSIFSYSDTDMLDNNLPPYDLRIEGTGENVLSDLAAKISRVHGFPVGTVKLKEFFPDEYYVITGEDEELFLGVATFRCIAATREDLTLAELFGVDA